MRKQIGTRMQAVFAAFLVALAVTILPDDAARAANDCIAAPNSEAPQGSHWYYRIDRVKQRKCWYFRPQGQKVRNAEPQVKPAKRLPAPVGAETAGDGRIPPTQVVQPPQKAPPATTGSVRQQGSVEGTSFTMSRSSSSQPAGTIEQPGAAMSAPAAQDQLQGRASTETKVAHDTTQVRQPVTATTEMVSSTTVPLSRMLLMFASALAAAGILHFTIFKMFAARQRLAMLQSSSSKDLMS